MTGAHLVVVPSWASRSPEEFLEMLARERVTVLNQTRDRQLPRLPIPRSLHAVAKARLQGRSG
jgi:non-ribosomal peptide synthetase component F